ncbi:MAG: aldo/keto reductase [Desulfobacteraceae bacterium]
MRNILEKTFGITAFPCLENGIPIACIYDKLNFLTGSALPYRLEQRIYHKKDREVVEERDHFITRKKFLKISAAGLLGVGLLGKARRLLAKPQKTQTQEIPEYRILGRTGIKVSAVGYGASRTLEPSLVKAALETGINFLDTGRRYFRGQHEAMLGKVIKGIRQKVIIQSKIRIRPAERGEALDTQEMRNSRRALMETSLRESLHALQTDYIDIMLLHGASTTEVINDNTVMEFFLEAKRKGKIRACGFSSHANQLELVRDANRSKFYDVIMVPYNHKGAYRHSRAGYHSKWNQSALEEELKKAENNRIGIVAMKTCSGGPYSSDGVAKPTFKDALKWILSHSYISTMAVAMANIKEIKEDVQAMF